MHSPAVATLRPAAVLQNTLGSPHCCILDCSNPGLLEENILVALLHYYCHNTVGRRCTELDRVLVEVHQLPILFLGTELRPDGGDGER